MRTSAAFVGVIAAAAIGWLVLASPNVLALDFRAFYCAGHAARVGDDPYRTSSLQTCERTTDAVYSKRLPTATLPAPQPPYDIALFALFAASPFPIAKALWGAMLGVALFGTAVAFARLTSLKAPVVLAVLGTSLFAFGLALGQLVPLFMLALCASALALKEQRPRFAGIAAALTLIEPHLGMPVCLALLVWKREARLSLLFMAAALAIASVAATGVAAGIEYFTTVLPLHALSELDSDGQLSLSVILHALGISASSAIAIGSLSYILFCLLGVVTARAVAVRYAEPAFLVAVPAATAVLGGTFVHATDIVAALPLAALLLRESSMRAWVAPMLIVLQTTWTAQTLAAGEMTPWFAFSAIAAAYVAFTCGRLHAVASVAIGAAVFVALLQINAAYFRAQADYLARPTRVATVVDDRFPQAGWSQVIASSLATRSTPSWVMRAPTWLALLFLLGTCTALSRYEPAARRSPAKMRV